MRTTEDIAKAAALGVVSEEILRRLAAGAASGEEAAYWEACGRRLESMSVPPDLAPGAAGAYAKGVLWALERIREKLKQGGLP